MKILFFVALYPTAKHPFVIGGAELLIKELAEELVRRGDEVVVVRAGNGKDLAEEHHNGVRVLSLSARNIYQPFTGKHNVIATAIWHLADDWTVNAPEAKALIRGVSPDIIHTNTLSGLTAGLWSLAADLSIPTLHTLHDYYLICPRCTMYRNGSNCAKPCSDCSLMTIKRRYLARRVQAVVGVSRKILDIHLNLGLFADAKVTKVIHNFASVQRQAQPYRIAHPVRVGFIGRLSEEKGIFLLAEAMNRVPNSIARLVVAGSGDPEIKERVRRLAPNTDITFMGFVAPPEFYNAVDLVVAPALWEEPGAMIIGEARSFGRPVLAGNVGAATELLQPGLDGWIVPLKIAPLADAIIAIVSDLSKLQSAQKGALLRSKDFSFGHLVDQYRDVYKQLCFAGVGVRASMVQDQSEP